VICTQKRRPAPSGKEFAVTDEQSGLLKRASYIDLLMAETRRAVQQSTPVTVL